MRTNDHVSYTTEEIAQLLKVSKLTVYDLIKKGELPAYRVGRQMRVDAHDLESYKENAKSGTRGKRIGLPMESEEYMPIAHASRQIIISGQDISLDILANYIEKDLKGCRPLRSYAGSLNSLISMYQGEADIVSTHLFDGDTGEYNVPYIRRILVGRSYIVVNFLSRWEGFYVTKGNPKNLHSWTDLTKPEIKMVNREKGSGARVLVDEQLRIQGISPEQVNGYEIEESSHIGVAGKVATGEADVGVGIEKAAHIVGVDFIPLIKERYDLVILKTIQNKALIDHLLQILRSDSFQKEIQAIGGYDLSQMGQIMDEAF
ncbi:helix-turn-helix transcriptional regulator [Bacillus sp. B190/17]|uniref:Helix-turn-helix transcriptional regulator n=1 Tax=Bacillus lumedeiriae TaxID=3058829 RepID=A0ABW8ID24_9BACI